MPKPAISVMDDLRNRVIALEKKVESLEQGITELKFNPKNIIFGETVKGEPIAIDRCTCLGAFNFDKCDCGGKGYYDGTPNATKLDPEAIIGYNLVAFGVPS